MSIAAPRATLTLIAIVTTVLGSGLLRLHTDTGYRSFLGSQHPSVVKFDEFIDTYGGGLPITAVWSCDQTDRCDSIFDHSAINMAAAVSLSMEKLPGVRRVRSPATSALLTPGPEGFTVARLHELHADNDERASLIGRALLDPFWNRNLIAQNGRVGAITIELSSSDSAVTHSVVRALQARLAPYEAVGFQFHLVGDPVEYVVAGGELDQDTGRLVPVMVILIGLTILLLFQSTYSVIIALVTVGVAVLWTMGLMGWVGWPQTNVTQPLAPLILVIGVCNAIHVLSQSASSAKTYATDSKDRVALILNATSQIATPCTLAALTTAAGFLAFTTSGLQSFSQFGSIAACGILFSLVLSFSLLPICLLKAPARSFSLQRVSVAWEAVLQLIVRSADRRSVPILISTTVLLVLALVGMSQIRIDADIYALYGEQSRVVRWARFVEDNLRRPDTLEIDLRTPPGLTFEDPEALSIVEELSRRMESMPSLGRAMSLVDSLQWINRISNNDDPNQQRVGASASLNAELLFLLSLEGSESLDPWLTLGRSRARISVEASKEPQTRRSQIIQEVDAHLEPLRNAGWSAELTGPLVVAHDLVREVQRTQLRSLAAAIAVVLLLVWLFLRQLGWAMLAMIPTTLPVFLTLGTMGWWDITLDVGTAMVSAIVIGIAVDDTVHLLFQYRRHRGTGLPASKAIEASIVDVGQAIVTTSLALTIGLFALVLSPWQSVASFGLLSGLAITGALIADLTVLPALIMFVQSIQAQHESRG